MFDGSDSFPLASKPTIYGGQRFNSRLEAQWAAYFDDHGIQWVYEPYRLHLSNGTIYLPDFFLPAIDTWFEVKGVVTEASRAKPGALSDAVAGAGQIVAIGTGDGTLHVPFRTPDGELDLRGAIVRCSHCREVWFASLCDLRAASCRHCWSPDGGAPSLSAARAAGAAGVRIGWTGDFDPFKHRKLITDA